MTSSASSARIRPCELLDLAGAEQSRRPRIRHRHEPARLDVEIDGGGETDRLIEARLRRSLGRRRAFGRRPRPPRLACRAPAPAPPLSRGLADARPPRARAGPLLLALQLSRVGRTQLLLSGTFRVGDVCELNGLTRHDGRDGVLVDELRMSVAAQQDAEIIEPGHDALQLHAIHEKDGQRRLVLANMIEKRVLKDFACALSPWASPSLWSTLTPVRWRRTFALPRLSVTLDAIERQSRKGPDAKDLA